MIEPIQHQQGSCIRNRFQQLWEPMGEPKVRLKRREVDSLERPPFEPQALVAVVKPLFGVPLGDSGLANTGGAKEHDPGGCVQCVA